MRGYALTGKEEFLEPYQNVEERVRRLTDSVALLTADNGLQRVYLAQLRQLVKAELGILRNNISFRRQFGSLSADSLAEDKRYMDRIRNHIEGMKTVESDLANR